MLSAVVCQENNGWFKAIAQLDANLVSHMVWSVTPAGLQGLRDLFNKKQVRALGVKTKASKAKKVKHAD